MSAQTAIDNLAADRITSRDSPDIVNSKLKKYRATLFDVAYYLAISLTEQFRPHSYFGQSRKDILKIQSLLRKVEKMLAPYKLLKDLSNHVKNKQKEIIKAGIYKRRGIYLDIKTQLILLWAEYLRKIKTGTELRPPKNWNEIDERKIKFKKVKAEVRVVDWDVVYRLLSWFYHRLEQCSYSKIIKPDQKKVVERRNLKLRYHMSWLRYSRSVSITSGHYEQAQEYFKKKYKRLPIKTIYDDSIYSDSYPIIQIKFNKDDIVIGELRENGILQDRFLFTAEGRVIKKTLGLKNHEGIKTPTVIFPNRDQFPI